MVRNIILLVIVAALLYFGYYEWQQNRKNDAIDSGDVTCQGCMTPDQKARFAKENSGDTPDGNSEHKPTSARVAAEEAVTGSTAPQSTGISSMTPPPAGFPNGTGSTTASSQPVIVPTTPDAGAVPGGVSTGSAGSYPGSGYPSTDSQSPSATNGMRFAGSGSYLVYRQGDITYRLDTQTGHSCVIYATMEEWRKPIVMSHGCGRTA
jgi:hypothetical protein